jgi:CheY-like chemotaxis protein
MLATGLTQQLLTFSKGGAPIKKTTTITELVVDSTSFTLRGANVKCDYRLAEDLWPIAVDQGQLSQVVQNLVINASQAMPDGGTVIIRGKNITVDTQGLSSLPAGNYVELVFEDHGFGIPIEHLPKIFDPYFTTKETGSGLGLAIAYSIIKKHDGWIEVDSEVARGTAFIVYLPAEKDASDHISLSAKEKACITKVRVLVMDDEAMVRNVVAKMLQHFSCEPVTACDGSEAIELYQQAMAMGRPFSLVIMDLTVPGAMGGQEALAKLRVIDPKIKAIASSGYANDPVMSNFQQYGFSDVLPKPFRTEQLGEALAKIIPA